MKLDCPPIISVIIPCYNAERTIPRCLYSLLHQTFHQWEAICIDDGSSDDTYHLLQAFSKKDSRIIAKQQHNKGVAITRLVGVKLARGKYVTFLDSDDSLESHFLNSMLTLFNPDFDIVVSGFNLVLSQKKTKKIKYKSCTMGRLDYLKAVLTGAYGWELCGKLYRLSLFQNPLYTSNLIRIGEDALHFIQLITYSRNIRIAEITGYNYIQSESSISKNKDTQLALETLKAASAIDQILRRKDYYSEIRDEVNSMYLLFYSNSTRRAPIGWHVPAVLEVYEKHLTAKSLLKISSLKAIYILLSLSLAKFISWLSKSS